MMGHQPPPQENLFYSGFGLDSRVRKNHPLRAIARTIDFEFVYGEVKGSYGRNGNVSVPPTVILKLMLLLIAYNVRSERELMETLPERLDWLWFLGYGLDSKIPNHSVLSKAHAKWGSEVFISILHLSDIKLKHVKAHGGLCWNWKLGASHPKYGQERGGPRNSDSMLRWNPN